MFSGKVGMSVSANIYIRSMEGGFIIHNGIPMHFPLDRGPAVACIRSAAPRAKNFVCPDFSYTPDHPVPQ
jgi:hypothetical protein